MRLVRNVTLAVCLLLAATPAVAAEPRLALIRVESLDGLLADVQRVAALTRREMSREELLAPIAGALGGADLSWVDGGKPWVAIASMAALAQGPQALVVAIPVRSENAAVTALGGLLAASESDEDGVRTLSLGARPTALVFRGGYLVASPGRELALAFRPGEALQRGDLPPGNLAVDVQLEAVAPMALAGLESARRALEQRMTGAAAEPGSEAPQDGDPPADPDLAAGETKAEEAPAAPEMDPAAIGAIMDLYLDLARNLIRNTSRLQMSIELAAEHLIVHQRVLPLAGSTLEGLLAAQQGGLPELARLIDPGSGSFVVTAGQMRFTPAFLAATKEFMKRYASSMETVAAGLEDVEGAPPMGPWMRLALQDIERWPDCYRGDFAGRFGIDPERGFQGIQVVGARDPALCQTLIERMTELAATLTSPEGDEPPTVAEADAVTYKGVRATRYQVNFREIASAMEEDEAPAPAWIRQDFVTYTGLKDDLVLSAVGPDAEADFRQLVDRTLVDSPIAGITASQFAPLDTGPGVFAAIDLSGLAAMMPAEAGEEAAALFASMAAGGSRLVYGVGLGRGALHAQVATPLSMISAIARAAASAAAEAPTQTD